MSDPWPVGTTRLVALVGWPARYSLSPVLHNAAFRESGLDMAYLVLPCTPADLGTVVSALRAVDAVGANVTVPHKAAVLGLCDHVSDEVRLVGAANTLVVRDGQLHADNTDATGLEATWRDEIGIDADTRIVVVGTGGAARAAAVAAGRIGATVTVVGRRAEAANEVAMIAEHAGAAHPRALALDGGQIRDLVDRSDLIVNATPLGMAGEGLPEELMALSSRHTAHDLVYAPPSTPFLDAARSSGATIHNGLGMLVRQAAGAFERWTGQPAPLAVMHDVAARAADGPQRLPHADR